MILKKSHHFTQQKLHAPGHNIPEEDVLLALYYPDYYRIGEQSRGIFEKKLVDYSLRVVVSCACSAGQAVARIVTAHQTS